MGLFNKLASVVGRTGLKLPQILMILAALVAVLSLGLLWLLWRAFGVLGPAVTVAVAGLATWWAMQPQVLPKMHRDPQVPGTVRFVAISDTHNKHAKLDVPPGDVLLCAGDFTYYGTAKVG